MVGFGWPAMFQPVRMDVFRISGIYMYMGVSLNGGFWVACHVSASPDGCFSDIWYLHVYGCFLKWWVNSPQIIPFVHRVFHEFHHPFWGTTIFGNTHTFSKKTANIGFLWIFCFLGFLKI